MKGKTAGSGEIEKKRTVSSSRIQEKKQGCEKKYKNLRGKPELEHGNSGTSQTIPLQRAAAADPSLPGQQGLTKCIVKGRAH